MITISTTAENEARAMTALMDSALPVLEYRIYLLGREVAAGSRAGSWSYIPQQRVPAEHR